MANNQKDLYVCPMQAEIEQNSAGLCPERGMNLIPAAKLPGADKTKTKHCC